MAYRLVADLDAFLFETRSLYEITGRLLEVFCTCMLGRPLRESELLDALKKAGVDVQWVEVLRKDRIHFFHQSAPWLAIEVTGGNPPYELLILRRNIRDLANSEDYARLADYRAIFDGYRRATNVLPKWLLRQIELFERRESQP